MKLVDLVVEGSGDLAQRERARALFEAIRNHFLNPGRVLGNLKTFQKNGNVLRVAFPCKKISTKDDELNDMLRGLVLIFTGIEQSEAPEKFENSGGFHPPVDGVPAWIDIRGTYPLHVGDLPMTNYEWQYHIAHNGAHILRKNRDTMMHEIIHYLDSLRWKDDRGMQATYSSDDGRSSDIEQAQAYFSDPAEMNAYAQESLASVEDELKNVKTREEAISRMGGSATDLYKKVYEKKLSQFGDQVPDDVLRRLKKRVAQLWNDVLYRFST